jgi:hypothetical protein
MGRKIPFVGRIFWVVLIVVWVLVVVGFVIAVKLFGYTMQRADYGGSFIASIIAAYLIHLWLLPGEYAMPEDEAPPEDDAGPGPDEEETL